MSLPELTNENRLSGRPLAKIQEILRDSGVSYDLQETNVDKLIRPFLSNKLAVWEIVHNESTSIDEMQQRGVLITELMNFRLYSGAIQFFTIKTMTTLLIKLHSSPTHLKEFKTVEELWGMYFIKWQSAFLYGKGEVSGDMKIIADMWVKSKNAYVKSLLKMDPFDTAKKLPDPNWPALEPKDDTVESKRALDQFIKQTNQGWTEGKFEFDKTKTAPEVARAFMESTLNHAGIKYAQNDTLQKLQQLCAIGYPRSYRSDVDTFYSDALDAFTLKTLRHFAPKIPESLNDEKLAWGMYLNGDLMGTKLSGDLNLIAQKWAETTEALCIAHKVDKQQVDKQQANLNRFQEQMKSHQGAAQVMSVSRFMSPTKHATVSGTVVRKGSKPLERPLVHKSPIHPAAMGSVVRPKSPIHPAAMGSVARPKMESPWSRPALPTKRNSSKKTETSYKSKRKSSKKAPSGIFAPKRKPSVTNDKVQNSAVKKKASKSKKLTASKKKLSKSKSKKSSSKTKKSTANKKNSSKSKTKKSTTTKKNSSKSKTKNKKKSSSKTKKSTATKKNSSKSKTKNKKKSSSKTKKSTANKKKSSKTKNKKNSSKSKTKKSTAAKKKSSSKTKKSTATKKKSTASKSKSKRSSKAKKA
jgi:hypothetical protein